MSDAKVRGVVHLVEQTKTYGQNGFRKRLVVLEQNRGRFTNYVPLEFISDACDSVDGLQAGDEVEVLYRLSGRKWQRDENSEVKFFLNAEATEFHLLNKKGASAEESRGVEAMEPDFDDSDDEVPF